MELNKKFWENKRVFITGHTGFKGSWLLIILLKLGAIIKGYSDKIEENSLFKNIFNELNKDFSHTIGDIRDEKNLTKHLEKFKPEIIIHLAAQPLVIESYQSPLETWDINLFGTLKLLDTVKNLKLPVSILIITTDKVYRNENIKQFFSEKDPLGGYDPYSASKAATEIAVESWRLSYCKKESKNYSPIKIATARAGNVIGGGDWAKDRIVPDAIRALIKNEPLFIRNPNSVRPWQHVLDPLFGYLKLSEYLHEDLIAEDSMFSPFAFNFGPPLNQNKSVKELIENIFSFWEGEYYLKEDIPKEYESKTLSLLINKSKEVFNWEPKFEFELLTELTIKWYLDFHLNSYSGVDLCLRDINKYLNKK